LEIDAVTVDPGGSSATALRGACENNDKKRSVAVSSHFIALCAAMARHITGKESWSLDQHRASSSIIGLHHHAVRLRTLPKIKPELGFRPGHPKEDANVPVIRKFVVRNEFLREEKTTVRKPNPPEAGGLSPALHIFGICPIVDHVLEITFEF
jgi:hypothetical protein